ncbi:FG-GAP repeat domain-containing protein [Lysobacter terrae]
MNKIAASMVVVAVIAVGGWLVWRKPAQTGAEAPKAPTAAPEPTSKPLTSKAESLLWHDQGGGNQIWRINGGSAQPESLWSVESPWSPVAYVARGWSGDDLAVWQNPGTGEVRLWRIAAGNPTPSTKELPPASAEWRIAAFADVNGDGYADAIWLANDGQVAVWLMADGEVGERAVVGNVGTGWELVSTADFNGDGKQDLLWRNDELVAFWYMDGTSLRSSATKPGGGEQWNLIAAGRFDADANADLLWQDKGGQLVIWRSGDPATSLPVARPVPAGWSLVQAADLDGNGIADLVWREASSGNVGAWIFGKDGGINDLALPPAAAEWSVLRNIAPSRETH